MRKVIEGQIYDTETAEKLHSWDNGCYTNDFNYCEETLYLTKKGSLFLYGEGGALSRYASSLEGGRSHGSGNQISLFMMIDAIPWLEEHDGDDVLCDHPYFKDQMVEA